MDAAALEAEFASLTLPRFAEAEALALGGIACERALAAGAPVVIDIRTGTRILFHAALPGSTPLNDLWIARKSATALLFQLPSLLVGQRNRDKGETLARHGLAPETHADHGGALPIRVAGCGMVACLTVSGLPQAEDHALAVAALRALAATL
ncbi:heme-degrading domain-containing protein [Xinfangfangia pollutisoli]|uniref:heme-degrading domain-containing protein n=1 Tax=Xinfangfangia pollutisoli TaxID=2865960 RepID=UPI001CD5B3E4|nr:heme-binding protein [Xinfangfangia pollutisoli]